MQEFSRLAVNFALKPQGHCSLGRCRPQHPGNAQSSCLSTNTCQGTLTLSWDWLHLHSVPEGQF